MELIIHSYNSYFQKKIDIVLNNHTFSVIAIFQIIFYVMTEKTKVEAKMRILRMPQHV